MDADLSWLVGLPLSEVERLGPCVWRFRFGPDAEVRSECPWRIVRGGGIVLSNEDHSQQFGLTAPLDAEVECRALIVGGVVRSAEVRAETRDFVVGFGPGLRLELVPLSSGYESWQVARLGRTLVVAMGGGELAVWRTDAEPHAAADRGLGSDS